MTPLSQLDQKQSLKGTGRVEEGESGLDCGHLDKHLEALCRTLVCPTSVHLDLFPDCAWIEPPWAILWIKEYL